MSDPALGRGAPRRSARSRLVATSLVVVAVLLAVSVRELRTRAAARSAFPAVEGRIRVEGIAEPVEIFRDAAGIPHVEAAGEEDAFFGLGFAHAQDRLAQMLWMVRVARGRTAEVIGPEGLPADRLARTLDLGGLAEAELARADSATRRALVAYARGVTARIERIRAGAVGEPLALRRARMPLEDWRPSDSVALLKLYAWGLTGSLDVHLVLSDLIESLGGFGARRFFPGSEVLPVPARPPMRAGPPTDRAPFRDPLRRAAGLWGRAIGSSAWVVGGAHSRSGLPIVAADAHLEPTVPPLFHVAHFRGGGLDVAGATLPGVPVVWTGKNDRVAWASTHAPASTTDLFVETLHATDPDLYHDGNGWRELEVRVESIGVRGGEPEVLVVRSTRHGPLVHELLGEGREPLSLAWAGARVEAGSSIAALLAAARARDAGELVRALAGHREPPLAVVYADVTGAAGVQVAGWIPERTLASGLVPLPGRARWYDWTERIAFERLPRARLAEGRGWLVAADNRLASPEGGGRIEWLWQSGERAERIDALLRFAVGRGPVDLREVVSVQTDLGPGRARALVELALELAGRGGALGSEAREVADLLRRWDGRETAGSVGSAAYHVFRVHLTEALMRLQLDEGLMRRYLALPQADPGQIAFAALRAAAAGGEPGGWTDPDAVSAAVRASLREAWLHLSFRLGANRSKWNWGRLHPLRFRALGPPVARGREPEALGPFSHGGSDSTVNTAGYDPAAPFAVRVASLYRFGVDAGALDQALASLAPGQSEHPRHPHFGDGLADWMAGRPRLLATSRLVVEESSSSRLVLEPRR